MVGYGDPLWSYKLPILKSGKVAACQVRAASMTSMPARTSCRSLTHRVNTLSSPNITDQENGGSFLTTSIVIVKYQFFSTRHH